MLHYLIFKLGHCFVFAEFDPLLWKILKSWSNKISSLYT